MEPDQVLGIDPSTKRLAVVGADEARLIDLTGNGSLKTYRPASAAIAHREVKALLSQLGQVEEVWLEAPAAFKSGIQSSLLQAYVNGAIQAAVAQKGRKVLLVAPATWKKTVCGHGHATKEDVASTIEKTWPEMWPRVRESQDLIDAAAIHLHGVSVERRRRVA